MGGSVRTTCSRYVNCDCEFRVSTYSIWRGSTQLRDTWRGHLPITYEVLLPILERAAAGETDFSRAERMLYTTCEFWAAVIAQSIAAHLGSEAMDNLGDAIVAFSTIGAEHVANTLNAVLSDLSKVTTKQGRLACFAALEHELSKTDDRVDQLIARFASDMKQSPERQKNLLECSPPAHTPRYTNADAPVAERYTQRT
jgi:hypothetical protein